MWNAVKRWWKYRVAKTERSFNERADPAVQLEQAIAESREQHGRLRQQAANVIANQKQAEMRLNRLMDDYERLTGNTRQAVLMADQATRTGDDAKAAHFAEAAEAFASRLISMEGEVEQTKSLVLQASQAAEQAKGAVAQNSQALQRQLADRQKLLSQLDQAKMQEQLNAAMSTLNEVVGTDVPTLNEVQDKIEARYARAKGIAELTGQSVETHLLEVERAAMNVEAQARLSEIRAQLGIEPPAGTSPPPLPGATPANELSQPNGPAPAPHSDG
jgi:phage shock protein A